MWERRAVAARQEDRRERPTPDSMRQKACKTQLVAGIPIVLGDARAGDVDESGEHSGHVDPEPSRRV